MKIDLTAMPSGERYEDRYGAYMAIFKQITECNDELVYVKNPPASWIPLLKYLNCTVYGVQFYFEHDDMVSLVRGYPHDRTAVEVLCGFRPETVDALWKVDTQWEVAPNRRKKSEGKKEFIVTNNGSFHRQEVIDFIGNQLAEYKPKKKKVVLVPCAADKPYPSRMHKAVLDRMPEDYYLANATGVLGLVPQDLWPVMPHYDSGLPNEWRLQQLVKKYFEKYRHEKVVVYLDYYSKAVKLGLERAGYKEEQMVFVNPVIFYFDYLPLHEDEYLKKLEEAFKES
jgi:hypothetical protein